MNTETAAPAAAEPPWEVVEPAATEQAAGPAPSTDLAVFDPIAKTIADIEQRHKNVVYDLTTTKGNDEARKARKELVTARTTADEVYETWNKPILAAQKEARALRDGFKARVELLEKPLDAAIKADEERRAAEKKAKEEAEAKRLKAIRDRISEIYALPAALAGSSALDLETAINVSVPGLIGDKSFFEEMKAEAEAAAEVVVTKLGAMMSAAKAAEEQAEALRQTELRLAAERAEIDRQRAELAAQQEAARQAAASAEAARRAEEVRLEQERQAAARQAADQAEKARLAEEEAGRRRQAEAQIRLDAIAQAEREAAARIAEQQRLLTEQKAAFEAEQVARRAPLERTEAVTESGATVVSYVPATTPDTTPALAPDPEPPAPVLTTQEDAFEVERNAEAARAAALPKAGPVRPADERLTEVVAKAFDIEPALAAEWLGTYDAFAEIERTRQA